MSNFDIIVQLAHIGWILGGGDFKGKIPIMLL
jgi:hypothetical protein